MKAAVQPKLPGLELKEQKWFGGSLFKSHPKEQRAIPLDRSMHLVMRSKHAKGKMSFKVSKRAEKIFDIVKKQAERFNVRLYSYANAGNHLHMVIMPRSRRGYVGFIKAITGLIARATLGAERNSAKGLKFWDARPFTRIVCWGKDFREACAYLLQNTLEAHGFIPYRPRGKSKYPSGRRRPAKGKINSLSRF